MWPRSFRERIATVMDVTRGRGDEAICFTILSFCGRDWWAGHGPIEGDARVPAPMTAAEVLRWRVCDECQECPMRRPRRCTGCRAVSYCARQDKDGRAACQHEAWSGHKKACKAATKERKRRETVEKACEAAMRERREAEVAAVAGAAAVAAVNKKKGKKKGKKKR